MVSNLALERDTGQQGDGERDLKVWCFFFFFLTLVGDFFG